ncbi:hypothetical protein GCM10007112_18370 [Vulcanisaeta souniana JCM 11219]|uniref:Uncharacterized protein n=1 Tax=Vulcanisaeta souniana JCM 11219 TaxID=1293586 RepID=A0A830EL05_9CREN|nr:hypothetical protein GCM10007112_18370 [Vulcanisaeta souniana JCM 11219]
MKNRIIRIPIIALHLRSSLLGTLGGLTATNESTRNIKNAINPVKLDMLNTHVIKKSTAITR